MLARTEPRKILVVDDEPAAVCGTSAVRAVAKALGHIAMVIAAPIIGLLYILLFPFIGLALSLALLLWMAGEAAVGRVKGLLAAPAPQPA